MHWARKAWHMLGVFLVFICYMNLPEFWAKALMGFFAIAAIVLDYLRQHNEILNDYFLQIFRPIMRQHEIDKFAGTSYLLGGVLLVMLVFPKLVVGLTLLFLAFADPIASIVGILYGKDKIFFHKSLQGFAAAFIVCALCTFFYVSFFGYPMRRLLILSILSGLVGALAELIPLGKLDDNFTLPVLSSIGIFVLFYFFDVFAVAI